MGKLKCIVSFVAIACMGKLECIVKFVQNAWAISGNAWSNVAWVYGELQMHCQMRMYQHYLMQIHWQDSFSVVGS